MYSIEEEEIQKGITKYRIKMEGTRMSYREWISNIAESLEFIRFYSGILEKSDCEGFFWEVKPVSSDRLDEEFEFVLVESNRLTSIEADDQSFKEHFIEGETVVTFLNLGKDARLVVPTARGEKGAYAHLAQFLRSAPRNQVNDFWQKIGMEYMKSIGEKNTWLSTAGLGVHWLHVRIDSQPKYYRFDEYILKSE